MTWCVPVQAASILCSLSKDVDGIQVVKMAAKNVKTLIPQVCVCACVHMHVHAFVYASMHVSMCVHACEHV